MKFVLSFALDRNQVFWKNLVSYGVLLTALFFMPACGSLMNRLSETPPDSVEAQQLLAFLENKNNGLKTFKGIGKIRLWNKKGTISARLAWIGAKPLKLRIVLFGAMGQAAEVMATDGQCLYFLSHTQQQFKKLRSSDPSLKRIVSISIRASDVINLLAGRVPIQSYHSASIEKNESKGHVLVLKGLWGNCREKIYFDEGKTSVHKAEVFNANGSLAYRAEFDRIKTVGEHRLPFGLKLSDDDGSGFQMHIKKYWPNASVSPKMFVLTPQKEEPK